MPKRTSPYAPWLADRLQDSWVAAEYLRASLDSPEHFLTALRKVAEARQIARVAEAAGRQRESVYRMLSEDGNPRLDSLWAILSAMGLRIVIESSDLDKPKEPATFDEREEVSQAQQIPADVIGGTNIQTGTNEYLQTWLHLREPSAIDQYGPASGPLVTAMQHGGMLQQTI